MIRRPTVYEGGFRERFQEDLPASKSGTEAGGVHPRDVSRSDDPRPLDFGNSILLALIDAQAAWVKSQDRAELRRALLTVLCSLE